jgi:hypothetical protein
MRVCPSQQPHQVQGSGHAVEIFLDFTSLTGFPHPHLQTAINNCEGLLEAMGRSQEQILATLREMMPEFY